MVSNYKNGDLVWAKMKGFPPWPASITTCPKILKDGTTGSGKYSVLFFGTRETAQMKFTELYPYLEHRSTFDKKRKLKGFNEGLKEIRCAAGLEEDQKPDFGTSSLGVLNEEHNRAGSGRIRKPSSKISSDDFVLPPSKSRTLSKSFDTATSGINLQKSPSTLKSPIIKRTRLRTESNCSTGSNGSLSKRSKRVSYSDKLGLDFGLDYDPLLTTGTDPVFLNACLGSNSLSIFDEDEEKTRARRRTRSRVFDDLLMSPGKSPFRDRSRSISSNGGRSRLASGYSDAFEDLIESAHSIFNANELMAAIDQLPSEESDRPLTPEEPLPMPAPLKTCYACGCQCELLGLKWRCTSKICMKWNGTHKPQPVPSSSDVEDLHKSSEQVEIEQAVNAIKKEVSNFEKEYNQQQNERQNQLQQCHEKNHFSTDINSGSIKQEYAEPFGTPPIGTTKFQAVKLTQQGSTQFTPVSNFDYALAPQTSSASSLVTTAGRSLLKTTDPITRAPHDVDGLGNVVRKKCGRPKSYKVEKTPPMGPDGLRLCVFCNGQVRPQMCGGNKHRWRCVDKKCRKWYGWVLSCDEIPNDLGKKGRWKDLVVKVRQTENEDQIAVDSLLGVTPQMSQQIQPRRIGRPPKIYMEDDPNLDKIRTKFPPPQGADTRLRRKYTKKKRGDEFEIRRPVSPLTLRQMSYDPSALERHSRWWLQPRRRTEVSPERDFPASVLNNAATFRVIGNAMLSAAATKADEPGTIDGTLDLLLDSLASSMAPLLSLANKIPGVTPTVEHNETIKKLWKASAAHTPLF